MKHSILPCLALGLLALGGNAQAHEAWLCAGSTTVAMPDTGEMVTLWGFAEDDDNDLTNGCGGAVTVPGPRITVPPGDTSLTIHLSNGLPEPVSLVIPGQVTSMVPVRNLDGRVRSFTHETAPAGVQDYIWPNLAPGTYAYHSGTHPAVQVQMGLYGAMTADAAAGEAYPGVPYDGEVMLFYSEIDPALHTAVITPGGYGPGTTTTSTIDYRPQYFLVNGTPFNGTTLPIDTAPAGQRTLLRFFNMGLKSHVAQLQGMHMGVIAEDGKPYPFAREQYSAMLAAGSTKDAIISPANTGSFPLYDRALALTNGPSAGGGLMSVLNVGTAPPPALDTVNILRARYDGITGELQVWATSTDPGASLSVVNPNGGLDVPMPPPATADAGALNGYYYSVTLASIAVDPLTATVNSSGGGTDTQSLPSTASPVAIADAYGTDEDTALNVPVAGVLGNDLDGGWLLAGEALQATIATLPANGSVALATDGSFTYTPNADFHGTDSFAYTAQAVDTGTNTVLDSSVAGTVAITVASVNDLPVAMDDAYAMDQNTTLTVAPAGVLANDSDVDSDPITAVLGTGPTNGTLSLAADGGFTYTPTTGFTGADSFTYQANDGMGSGNLATVAITVNAAQNQPPEAIDDFASTPRNTAVVIDVVANDIDPDGNIDPSTVTIATQPRRGGTVSVDPVTGAVTFTPRLNFRGTDVFRYVVSDTAGATSNLATVRVNVTR